MKTLLIAAILVMVSPVLAHDHSRPELDTWFRQQFSMRGPCCDGTEAHHVADVDWDTVCETSKCHYRVRLYEKWWDVPDEAVVYGQNLAGTALVWPVPTRIKDEVSSVFIRCFMPGVQG